MSGFLTSSARCGSFLTNSCSRCIQPRRSKKKWVTRESGALKSSPTQVALKQFDQQYRAQFKEDWPSMRLALLSLQKYGALLNNFSDNAGATQRLVDLGATDFVAPMSEKLNSFYAEKKFGGLARGSDPAKVKQDAQGSEYASDGSVDGSKPGSDDFRDPQVEYDESNRMNLGGNTPDGSLDESDVSSYSKGGRVTGPGMSEAAASWKDDYIVAPGYEAKLAYLIGREPVEYQPTDNLTDDVAVETIRIPLAVAGNVKCHVFPADRFDRFPPSKLDSVHGCLLYYTLDASSLLPVLALDIQPDDSVLDMCAAPGGKSIAMLNILENGGIVLNEPSTARKKRLESVLESYLPKDVINSGMLQVTSLEGEEWGPSAPDTFDKVLVDVPCTTDRLSARERDNNIFSVRRNQERWDLPSVQEELLCSALLSVKPGGDVVYSTCSFSSLQNDAVIQGALLTCREEYNMDVQVIDLSPLAASGSDVFKFSDTTRYGQLVVPEISRNFGPMYFARLRKVSRSGSQGNNQLNNGE